MKKSQHNLAKSNGFTLLELLIVITIIGVLMGLSVSVMFGITSQAEEAATITTVRKIDALLQQRIEAFDRSFTGNRKLAAVSNMGLLLASQNIYDVRDEVKEILAKKALFRFEFPQRMDERRFGDPNAVVNAVPTAIPSTIFRAVAAPTARQQLIIEGNLTPNEDQIRDRVILNWSKHRPETESAALLHFSLLTSGSFGVGAVDGDRFTSSEVADTDGDGLPEFVDAWGQPLRFYRWPTRLIDIKAPNPFVPVLSLPADNTDTRVIAGPERELASLLFKGLSPPPLPLPHGVTPRDLLLTDPDDAVGRLYSELERLDGTLGSAFSVEFNEGKYHTPETYHTPLIVSAGKDEALGLYEPTDIDYDVNGNSAGDPGEETAAGYIDNSFQGILGNLAQYKGTFVTNDGNAITETPSAAVRDQVLDNLSNRNRRAGGRR